MDKSKYDIIALGECLIDFVSSESQGKLRLEGNPGGAPANVLAIAAKLGHSTAMICKVGEDNFGRYLCSHIAKANIDTSYVTMDSIHPTTLAIVQLDEHGDRSFNFYRNQTADIMLNEQDIPFEELGNTAILHFGSLSLCAQPARQATFSAVKYAKEKSVCISYDPNLRAPLWDNMEIAKEMLLKGLVYADVAKISDEELVFLTGEKVVDDGVKWLFKNYSMQLLAVTHGSNGSSVFTRSGNATANTFDTDCIDTTGAGDAFWGASLSWLLEHNLSDPSAFNTKELMQLLDFANAAGSLSTTKKGAITAMPTRNEIIHCIKETPKLVV